MKKNFNLTLVFGIAILCFAVFLLLETFHLNVSNYIVLILGIFSLIFYFKTKNRFLLYLFPGLLLIALLELIRSFGIIDPEYMVTADFLALFILFIIYYAFSKKKLLMILSIVFFFVASQFIISSLKINENTTLAYNFFSLCLISIMIFILTFKKTGFLFIILSAMCYLLGLNNMLVSNNIIIYQTYKIINASVLLLTAIFIIIISQKKKA